MNQPVNGMGEPPDMSITSVEYKRIGFEDDDYDNKPLMTEEEEHEIR